MKKFLVLGLGMFAVFATFAMVSVANAQFVMGDRVEVVPNTYNLNIRPTPSTTGTALGAVNSGALGTVTGGPVSAQGYSWSKVRWDNAPEGWSVDTPWLKVISTSPPPSVDLKVNGSDNPSSVSYDSTFTASWISSGASQCVGSGNWIPQTDGGVWGQSTLPASGSRTLYARHFNFGYINPLQVGISCSGNSSVYDIVYLPVTQSPTSTPTSTLNQAPNIISFTGPTSALVGSVTDWFARAIDPEGLNLRYEFNWGDGTTKTIFTNLSGISGAVGPQHIFGSTGNFIVGLNVFDLYELASSRSLNISVSSVGTNQPPVVSGVSGPSVLKVGETGTWTVKAYDPENGSLSYSVVWGDEPSVAILPGVGVAPAPVQNTATFTHSYSNTGTYTPTFMVTDDRGQQAKTSMSVVVGGGSLANNPPYFVSWPGYPSSPTLYTEVDQPVVYSWSATDPDVGDVYGLTFTSVLDSFDDDAIYQQPASSCGNAAGTTSYCLNVKWLKAGTYTLKITVMDNKGATAESRLTVVVAPATIKITSNPRADSNGNGNVTIKQGDKITVTGKPLISGQLQVDYTRAFFWVDSMFSCSNDSWVLICTARQTGTSDFYIELYKDGQTYRSNIISVTVAPGSGSSKFGIGDRVQVTADGNNLNIRPTPSTSQTALGSVWPGAKGTVTGGPTKNQYTWWKVKWDKGLEGWSVGNYLMNIQVLPTKTSICGDINTDGSINQEDVYAYANYIFYGAALPSGVKGDLDGSGYPDAVDLAKLVDQVNGTGPAVTCGVTPPSTGTPAASVLSTIGSQLNSISQTLNNLMNQLGM